MYQIICKKYYNNSTTVPMTEYCLVFSYISSEYYELDLNLMRMKWKKEDNYSNKLEKKNHGTIAVVME